MTVRVIVELDRDLRALNKRLGLTRGMQRGYDLPTCHFQRSHITYMLHKDFIGIVIKKKKKTTLKCFPYTGRLKSIHTLHQAIIVITQIQ